MVDFLSNISIFKMKNIKFLDLGLLNFVSSGYSLFGYFNFNSSLILKNLNFSRVIMIIFLFFLFFCGFSLFKILTLHVKVYNHVILFCSLVLIKNFMVYFVFNLLNMLYFVCKLLLLVGLN